MICQAVQTCRAYRSTTRSIVIVLDGEQFLCTEQGSGRSVDTQTSMLAFKRMVVVQGLQSLTFHHLEDSLY
jgi:hypothetical protein